MSRLAKRCWECCKELWDSQPRIVYCQCGKPKSKDAKLCYECHAATYHKSSNPPRGEWRAGAQERVEAMSAAGLSSREIAEREGVSKNQVIGLCDRRGIPLGKNRREALSTEARLNALKAQMERVLEETKPKPEYFITERKQRTPEELAYTVRPLWREYVQ